MEATVPFEVPFALPTEELGIVETLEEHLDIMNLEVDTLEDYAGPLTGMDFAKCPTANSLTNVHKCLASKHKGNNNSNQPNKI
jgi:hypothetical protein